MDGNNCVVQIVEKPEKLCDAGPKALTDIANALDSIDVKRLVVNRMSSENWFFQNILRVFWIVQCIFYRQKLKKGSIIFVPFPGRFFTGRMGFWLLNERIKEKKNLKFITLLVDINSQRFGEGWHNGGLISKEEERFFKMTDVFIAQNETMRDWMNEKGYDKTKSSVLGLWDYASNAPFHKLSNESLTRTVSIAGNLDPQKCAYLEGLSSIKGVEWHLFGVGFNKRKVGADNVLYRGCYTPDELPYHIESDFGLVWDGHSIETCTGGFGHYLKLNCSHKLSLFLLLGIPVFIWDQAAAAKYVIENDAGWAIASLSQIPELIDRITVDEYRRKADNARKLAKRIRGCEYIKESFADALSILSKQ